MNKIVVGLIAAIAFATAGCSTWALGSAPAKDGYVYVVGQKGPSPAVWLCPSQPGKGDCKRIDVEEVSE